LRLRCSSNAKGQESTETRLSYHGVLTNPDVFMNFLSDDAVNTLSK